MCMGSFADEVKADRAPWSHKRVLQALGEDAEEFERLLADESVPIPALYRALRRRGIGVTLRPLYTWRDER